MIILKDGQPFTGSPNLDVGKITQAVVSGVWDANELAAHGLAAATPFVVPEGKVRTGTPRYTESSPWWIEEYDIADPPPPSAEEVRLSSFDAEADLIDIKARLTTATPAQIDAWIDANVTNVATARAVLKALVKVLVRVIS